jgi:hypothetical protein
MSTASKNRFLLAVFMTTASEKYYLYWEVTCSTAHNRVIQKFCARKCYDF